MIKPKRFDGKGKLVKLTAKMEKDMRLYCQSRGIKSESDLVRQAIAAYIYSDFAGKTLKPEGADEMCKQIKELRNTLDRIFKTS